MAVPMRTGTEKGPTNEVGYMGPAPIKWSMWTGDMEENVPDLRWPRSTKVYHQMRTDAQLAGLLLAVFLPIRRSRWVIDPNGARDEVVEQIASDLRLPIRGTEDPPPRARRRAFRHDDHLRHALLALVYGFMFFEQVGTVQPDGTWRLAKLPPRMPQTISKIETDDADDLTAIKQWPRPGDPFDGRPIAAGVLSPYIWEKEGGNWTGRSLLRACYRDWIVKDRLIRVDAVKHERFGIGIPYASAPAGASKETIERYAAMARAIRADAQSGVGLPEKGDIGVEGIRGTLPDTLASIHYHDQAMARSFLAMFLELGQQGTHGNRALGESFVDFFKMAVDAVAGWYADSTQAEVIDDIVTWNYGEDETPPAIDWDEDPESRMDAADLVALIDSGAVVVDDELRTWISDRWGVSDPGPNTPTPPGPSTGTSGVPAPEPGQQPTPVAVAASRTQHGSRRPFVHGRHPHFHPRVARATAGTRHSPVKADYNEDEPRDDQGKWTGDGGGGGSSGDSGGSGGGGGGAAVASFATHAENLNAGKAISGAGSKELKDAIASWTGSGSSSSAAGADDFNTALEAHLAGTPASFSAISGQTDPAAEAHAFVETLQHAPANAPELWRGIGLDGPTELTTVGHEFTLSPASFSSDEMVAGGFAGGTKYGTSGMTVVWRDSVPDNSGLLIKVEPDAQALNIQRYAGSYKSQKEWVSGGTFRVDSVDPHPTVQGLQVVTVTQLR